MSPEPELSEDEKRVILECLKAAAEGPFFPDWEFHTLFGLERNEMAEIVAAWPRIDWSLEKVIVAMNNSMNNLLGYPHGCEEEWARYISVTAEEVARVFSKWRQVGGLK